MELLAVASAIPLQALVVLLAVVHLILHQALTQLQALEMRT